MARPIAEAADAAAADESKMSVLRRLLRRTSEPAIVFTEYRDTLERMRQMLGAPGRRITVLHGGMSSAGTQCNAARIQCHRRPDACHGCGLEGLNLHHRCRLVIHFELPWSPSRLEQRTGRVDRIGQVGSSMKSFWLPATRLSG